MAPTMQDVDAVCNAINIANDVMLITIAILMGMCGAIIYSLWAVLNVKTRYMRLEN